MRIAVSSSPFRPSFAAGGLTQLEWVERCASILEADGILPAVSDFPRTDPDYAAQLRKVAVDLGLVSFGIDAPALFDPVDAAERDAAIELAQALGVLVVRGELPAPGEIPPATFVETVAAAKTAARRAKGLNVTLLATVRPGTLAADLAGLKHLLKDVDSAWLRACPRALDVREISAKDRYPALEAALSDDPQIVAAIARRSWLVLDAPASQGAFSTLRNAIVALRSAAAAVAAG